MNAWTQSPKVHDHHEAELLIPLSLLSFTIITGLYRYFFVLRVRSYYRPLLSDSNIDDATDDETSLNRRNHHHSQNHNSTQRTTTLGKTIMLLNYVVLLTFIAALSVVCLRSIIDGVWSGTLLVLYNVMSLIAFTANLFLMLVELGKGGQWSWANYAFWLLALAGESFIGWYHLESFPEVITPEANKYHIALVSIFGIRYGLVVLLVLLSQIHRKRESREDDLDALRAFDAGATDDITPNTSSSSRQPTWANKKLTGTYGTFSAAFGKDTTTNPTRGAMGSTSEDEVEKKLKAEKEERASAFKDFWPKIKRLLPFVYPRDDPWLQFMVFLTFFFLILGRFVNAAVPLITGWIVGSLTGDDVKFNPGAILLYVFFRYLQGSSGLVNAARAWAWVPIEQYSNSALTIHFFEHVHNLSLEFHLNRKTGELLRILDRGTSSIVTLLSTVLFQLVPVVLDVLIAVVLLCVVWSWKYAVIVFITIVAYIIVTVMVTEWRTQFRRAMISFDNDARAKAVDSLLNFETVKYYSAEEFEVSRYRHAIYKYMIADYKSQLTYQMLNLLQSFVITMGMLAGCLLCAYEISEGILKVEHFVSYIMYLNQLYQPLNWFGSYYRMLQQNFVDMEKMIKLLDQNQSVQDIPNAKPLIVTSGQVVFENVSFQYDTRQKGLSNINFTVPHGQTVALVGPTGSGKSTILRLLFRFYDVSSGRILIDGQDISQKSQASLREQIGVVPQDSVLFNDSIYYNINYGRNSATKAEVEAAAKAAQIHDKIQDFPDGYSTKVGERGLRLSGGEKQRVAIARTILKNPPIVLLDEATSALDSTTEGQIQAALARMTENRTTLVVAHRLSTIVHSDLILCIKDGVIVEQGTHDQLIEQAMANGGEGVYYEMWKQQIREELGDSSTVDGTVSDDSDSKKGKGRKQKTKDITATATIELPTPKSIDTASTATAAGVHEALLSPAIEPTATDPTELTQVIVEPTTPATPAAVSTLIDEAASSTNTGGRGEDSVPSSQPSSGNSTPKPKKKKNKKKN
ncbi:Homocysteine S-methyltransferase 1 [Linnemannia exigua]|uniref:Homocysteine S-methyltransferase 1 n=1 Tax=Linnemannia exigua TaxID=604196 RepID=A0AAD4DLN1_9FUNG|nr:Homocysteine S-methyltransferase 1 [Linnemannia exigua]